MLRFLCYLFVFVSVFSGAVVVYLHQPLSLERTTVLVLGEPVELISYDSTRNRWTVIQLTKDTHISGIFGLGTYRLDVLWKLGQSEATPSMYLRESLSEEFGTPIPYIIYSENDPFSAVGNQSFAKTKQLFTYQNILSFIQKRIAGNIDLVTYLRLIPKIQSMNDTNTDRYVLRNNSGLVENKEPDGAIILRFDRQAFDTRTTTAFEELPVRKEAKRIVVLNTTNRPAVGSRVGRIISKLGANVVAIGNDTESKVSSCELSGTRLALQSITAKRVALVFGCETRVNEEVGQGDLIVRVGELYAKRYMLTEQ